MEKRVGKKRSFQRENSIDVLLAFILNAYLNQHLVYSAQRKTIPTDVALRSIYLSYIISNLERKMKTFELFLETT
jgi:uncharacterized membrane protein YcaP (DUF421 family)